ncbi:hypothetical protein MCEMSE15_01656 [Fimbriimonadaceae bacterium]
MYPMGFLTLIAHYNHRTEMVEFYDRQVPLCDLINAINPNFRGIFYMMGCSSHELVEQVKVQRPLAGVMGCYEEVSFTLWIAVLYFVLKYMSKDRLSFDSAYDRALTRVGQVLVAA